jgi:hypothetical protein
MKKMKKIKFITCAVFILTSFLSIAQKKEDKRTIEWRYEIECAGIGADGTYLLKVFTYSNKKNLPMEQAKKNAVHAVLFKGFPGNNDTGCYTQKPICTNPNIEFEKREFFDTFFADGGKYMKYVFDSSDGNIDANDRMKVGKEFKVGILVSIAKDGLRKDMEAAGIIRGLSQF